MREIPLTKRNRMERMVIACTLLTSIWEEVMECEAGDIESGLLQNAVYAQVDINRIVWKLNELNGCEPQTDCDDRYALRTDSGEVVAYACPLGCEQTDCAWK